MAIIRKKDIKDMTKEELSKKMEDLKVELIKSRGQKATHGASLKIKEIKRTIARILTYSKQKNK